MKHLLTIFTIIALSVLSYDGFAQKKTKVVKKKVVAKTAAPKVAIKKKDEKVEPIQKGNVTSIEEEAFKIPPPVAYGPNAYKEQPPAPPIDYSKFKDLTLNTIPPFEWKPYLARKLQRFTDEAGSDGCPVGSYMVTLVFIVNEKGGPKNLEVISGGSECRFGEYAKRILSEGPYWPIAKDENNNPILSKQKTTITFKIEEE